MIARTRTTIAVVASALVALAAAAYAASHAHDNAQIAPAPAPTMAQVIPDYLARDGIIGDLEADVRRHPDQLDTRMLAAQYLQRFREAPDVGDLLRAVANAQLAMRYQPRYNVAAESTLASAYTALHKFRLAKRYADDVVLLTPWSPDARATAASLDIELGQYARAGALLSGSPGARADTSWQTAAARYAELTGNVSAARDLIASAQADIDDNAYAAAENRAWFHWRAGDLAFEAGDLTAAEADYKVALAIFPNYWHATNGLAKVYWASRRWREALAFAKQSADVYPLPEALGYEYDAQRALGDTRGAELTAKLIGAIERIGNTQGINDRLIAIFYSDHDLSLDRAETIARRDLASRDDIYAEDTLGWALAQAGRWGEALPHAERAAALGTQDPRLQFHTGMIELHNGKVDRARRRLRWALSLNAHFHPFFADEAQKALQLGL